MRYSIVPILLCLVALGCNRNKPKVEDTFDKEVMLKDITSSVILPAYDLWESTSKTLSDAASEFAHSQTEANLTALKEAFVNAHIAWNECSMFEFGPAAEQNLRLAINTFPADTAQIEANIKSGTYDLDAAQNADAKGFAAIDYILFEHDNLLFSSSARVTYVEANAKIIYDNAAKTNTEWQSYQSDFTSDISSSVGSSIGHLVNEMNFEFELLKNARIGIPLGKKTLGETQVEKLEGFYSGESNRLAISSLRGVRNAFEAKDKIGFDDYLNDLDARKDDRLLSRAILDLFDEIEVELEILDLRNSIDNDPDKLESLFSKTKQLVVLLKTDMPSQLGVQITFQDNDGD